MKAPPNSAVLPSRRSWSCRLAGPVVVIAAFSSCVLSHAASAANATFRYSTTPSAVEPYAACPPATHNTAQCFAIVFPKSLDVLPSLRAAPAQWAANGSGADHGFSPQDLESAYRLPSAAGGSGQTVAIVDAYDDPYAQSDLNVYRAAYDLPPCQAGCFSKVDQEGGTKYPAANAGWAMEISLDLDMVSAACPKCNILLVEARSETLEDLGIAENEAAKLGATEISNSYGAREIEIGRSQVEAGSAYYNHPGIPITVASGDYGFENSNPEKSEGGHCINCSPSYPAGLASVIAVGGTTLGPVGETGRGWLEYVWFYSGSGCTLYIAKPSWQIDKGCNERSDNDIGAVASGVSVYDTYAIEQPGWQDLGGTSASAPLAAGAIALESETTRSEGVEGIYKHPTNWYDVTEGSNYAGIGPECKEGTIVAYLCRGETGYDGPTGVGTPDGGASPTPPSATTEAASSVTTSGGTLNGDVDPEASETTYYFQYGRTALYGSTIPSTPERVPGYTAPVSEHQTLSGLKSQTEYHYRVISKSAGGTTYGPDQVFWTGPKLFRAAFGSKGAGEGKFEGPEFTATNGEGDVWVSDYTNDRVEEFSRAGAFIRSCGKAGSGNGEFKGPTGVAIAGNGFLYVSDSGDNRIEKLRQDCTYLNVLGEGEVSDPMGLTLTAPGGEFTRSLLLVANAGANDIALFDTEAGNAKLLGSYGVEGSGEGQFRTPTDITLAGEEKPYTDLFYIVDSKNNRVQEVSVGGLQYNGTLEYKFVRAFGSAGSGEGKFSSPTALALDPTTGDLDVTDTGNKRVEEFLPNGAYVSAFGSGGTSAESFERPLGLSVNAEGDLYIADATNNRVEIWSHPEWRDEPTPDGPREHEEEPESLFLGVSCALWSECETVGEYWSGENGGSRRPLAAERKNGDEWSRQAVPLPAGAKEGVLSSVSCLSSSWCIAVGEYESSASVKTALAEGWNGSTWSAEAAAVPSGAKKSYLQGVSCALATACTAVGTYESAGGVLTAMAEAWNGGGWTLQATATLSGETKSSHLVDIACTSTTACMATGRMVVKEGGVEVHHVLVERWNGSAWASSLSSPEGSLWAVSCSGEAACMAVGEGKSGGALGERWNGTEWLAQSMAQPEGGTGVLYGVSCGSASSCAAVGRVGTSASFAEQWNGTEWILQSTQKPENTEHAGLFGVWCTAIARCLAVGYAYAHVGTGYFPVTLGEVNTDEQDPVTTPPAVVTEAASAVEPTKATLHGSVNPEGAITKYHFQYGTSTSYGSSTAESVAGEGTSAAPELASVGGLVAGTTYHYRIVASSAAGTSYGADLKVTTAPPAFDPAGGASAFPVAFTSAGGTTSLRTEAGAFKCTGETGSGEFTSTKEGRLTIKLTGCKLVVKCGNVKEGEIETKELKGRLAYPYPESRSSEGREAGLVLAPASGEVFEEFTCPGLQWTVVVKGSVIAVVSPLGKRTKTLSLAIKQTSYLQEPSEYENESGGKVAAGLTCAVNGGTAKPCGEEEVSPALTLTGEEGTIEE